MLNNSKSIFYFFYVPFLILLMITGCRNSENLSVATSSVKPAVSVIYPKQDTVSEYMQFNAVTRFQRKDNIRATATGYVSALSFNPGDAIQSGSLFCNIATKEQQALKSLAATDSSLKKFQRPLSIVSNATGIISAINVLKGDFINEGDILATVSEPSSLVVVLNVPYEYKELVAIGKACEIILPDQKHLKAIVSNALPVIDVTSQSQSYLIRVPDLSLPENLNVTVRLIGRTSKKGLFVPIQCIQTDELQKEFWLMKVVNDSLALHIPVSIGIQTDAKAEITSANISTADLIITKGAFGLQDSSIVHIQK